MKISVKGLSLIKRFEGCKLTSYQDIGGVWTIGWGTTGPSVGPNLTITQAQADSWLQTHVDQFAAQVTDLLKVSVNQNQFDALVSFCYNLGPANLKSSTLLKKVNANPNDPTIRAEFLKWNKAGGKALAGLTRRRTAEANLYFS